MTDTDDHIAVQDIDYQKIVDDLKTNARQMGFQQLHVSSIDLSTDEKHLNRWLELGLHGEMDYMARHGEKRSHPEQLQPGTLRVISCRLNYRPQAADSETILQQADKAYISRYALGRDYHKLMRKRLAKLARQLEEQTGSNNYRAFVDSAPVLERAIAQQAGLGWIGKNTMLINDKAGSWFFLGEIYTDLPLPPDPPQATEHCGSCQQCLDICPTKAFIKPWQLDARRCISYLTIELKGAIPVELRPLIGNRIYGCDDCQLVCPWNKFSTPTEQDDFQPRHQLDDCDLLELLNWTEEEFLTKTEGSAIRRIGYERWLRNIAVALGNASATKTIIAALENKKNYPSPLVREHIHWALNRLIKR